LCFFRKTESVPVLKKSKTLHKSDIGIKTPILISGCDMQKIRIFKSPVKNKKNNAFYVLLV